MEPKNLKPILQKISEKELWQMINDDVASFYHLANVFDIETDTLLNHVEGYLGHWLDLEYQYQVLIYAFYYEYVLNEKHRFYMNIDIPLKPMIMLSLIGIEDYLYLYTHSDKRDVLLTIKSIVYVGSDSEPITRQAKHFSEYYDKPIHTIDLNKQSMTYRERLLLERHELLDQFYNEKR